MQLIPLSTLLLPALCHAFPSNAPPSSPAPAYYHLRTHSHHASTSATLTELNNLYLTLDDPHNHALLSPDIAHAAKAWLNGTHQAFVHGPDDTPLNLELVNVTGSAAYQEALVLNRTSQAEFSIKEGILVGKGGEWRGWRGEWKLLWGG